MGIKVLFIYPNTYGMNMLPPAIAMFSAILKKNNHKIKIFDTTYYSIDYGIDSDGSKMERLNVVPYSMDKKGIRLKNTDWKKDLKELYKDYEPDLIAISSTEDMWELGMKVLEEMKESSRECWSITVGMIRGISRIISGDAQMGEIGGPIRIAQFSRDAALQGLTSLVFFVALISINLGLVNLMPIPALDGGHLLFFIIEGIIGKPLPDSWQNFLLRGGIAFLLSLMLFVTIYDILRGMNN